MKRDGRHNNKNPTIFDVAAVAGVSKSTVSNVVRGADDVADTTRERVLEAIRRLNYKPNAIARQFVRQRTTILGVLVGDLDNPYYAQMARVVEREAFRCGYTAMFCNIEGEEEIALAGVDALLEHRIAGVVFLAFISRTPQLEEALRRAEVPIVFLGLSEQWGDSVGPEDAAQHYERIRMMARDDERFTFTGVKDAARIDSYYDPFGNLSIEQRARLEIARESYKGGRVEAAEGMRTHLLTSAGLSVLQRHQLEAYWDAYVVRKA